MPLYKLYMQIHDFLWVRYSKGKLDKIHLPPPEIYKTVVTFPTVQISWLE